MQKYPDIVWLKHYPMNNILKKAAAVITINSGVGVEALAEHKPVITLGQAFYNVPGLVYHSKQLDDLPLLIRRALTEKPNYLLMDQFINYLKNKHLVAGTWKNFSQTTVDAIGQRLVAHE